MAPPALLCALYGGVVAVAVGAGYSEERCSWRGRPPRNPTLAAAWPPSASSCGRTGVQSCLPRPTVVAQMVPADPAVTPSSSCTSDFAIHGTIHRVAHNAELQESVITVVAARVLHQALPLFRVGGPGGRAQASLRTPLRCGVCPGPGTFLFMGWSRFGEAWLGCTPRFQEFLRAYAAAHAAAQSGRLQPFQVPYVGASARQVEHVLSLLRGRSGKMVDLGSGDGRIVLAAHKCGLCPALGYELNPWLVRLAWLHAWRAGCASSVSYRRENLWKVSLRDCYNVSVFLAPSVLPLLEDKLQAELPVGARVVSGRFPLPTWQPVAVVGEGLDRVWAYDVHRGGPAGPAVPGPSSASVPGAPSSQAD